MKEKFDIATFPTPDAEELDFIRQCLPETEGLDRFLERCTIYGKFLYTTNETMNLGDSTEDLWDTEPNIRDWLVLLLLLHILREYSRGIKKQGAQDVTQLRSRT